MGEVKRESRRVGANQRGGDGSFGDENGYYLVQRKDGKLRCSCGAELIKHDEDSWKCSHGYPIYRPQDGDIVKDKSGELMFKMKPHNEGDGNGNKE